MALLCFFSLFFQLPQSLAESEMSQRLLLKCTGAASPFLKNPVVAEVNKRQQGREVRYERRRRS